MEELPRSLPFLLGASGMLGVDALPLANGTCWRGAFSSLRNYPTIR